jgi:membrane-associated phospholipid phosphatase
MSSPGWRSGAKGFAAVSLISFAAFILVPIENPKPHVPDPRGMYWLLMQYDAPYTSLPSLHAGLLVYTLAFGRRILGDAMPRGLWSALLVWAGLILYATVATKEHYAIDIVAGVALALVVDWWTWRDLARRRRGGEAQDAEEQGTDVPRRIEVMVGFKDRVDVPGQVEDVAQ